MNIPIPLETLAALLTPQKTAEAPTDLNTFAPNGECVITVLDRGFVYVGRTTVRGDFVEITNARNIRVWGTTEGLGQLRVGPTKETKTDVTGTVVAPVRAVIHFIKCSRDW